MPIFEFVCESCQHPRRFSVLVGVVADAKPPVCPRCGSDKLKKVVSRFARLRSDDERFDALTERMDGVDESDPKAMRAALYDMVSEAGDDLGEGEVDELVEEAMSDTGGEE